MADTVRKATRSLSLVSMGTLLLAENRLFSAACDSENAFCASILALRRAFVGMQQLMVLQWFIPG